MAAAAHPSNPADVDFFTGSYLRKTYQPAELQAHGVGADTFKPPDGTTDPLPGYVRDIPVQSISKGMLLFHYFRLPAINAGETDPNYKRRLAATILSQHGINVTYNPHGVGTWEFCFGISQPRLNYYYPAPIIGTGVNSWGTNYNACVTSSTRRDMRWAYLKSGSRANLLKNL